MHNSGHEAASTVGNHSVHKYEERFHLLTSVLPVGVFYSDAFGHCLYVNKKWQEITGRRVEECLREGWKNAIDPQDRERVLAQWAARLTAKFVSEFLIVTPTGEQRSVRFRTEPMLDRRGTLVGHAGILDDITEARQIECQLGKAHDEALRAARLDSAFVTSLSNEIRATVAGIHALSNGLLHGPSKNEQRAGLEMIRATSEALLPLLADCAASPAFEGLQPTSELRDFDLQDLLESTLQLFATRAQIKGLEIGYVVPPEIPVLLRGYPHRLRGVLINLLSNAVRFTKQGHVCVGVETVHENQTEVTLRFQVRDTGAGIAPEALQSMFEPVAPSPEMVVGAGLGLMVSHDTVKRMRGEIGAATAPGKGATFWFSVRLIKQEAKPQPLTGIGRFSQVQVLVAIGDPVTSQMLEAQLRRLEVGWLQIVSTAGEAAAALDRATHTQAPYHLAIFDSGALGFDVGGIPSHPALAKTQIVLLTSPLRQSAAHDQRHRRVDAFITKPARRSRLLELLLQASGSFVAPAAIESGEAAEIAGERILRVLVADDNAINRKIALGQLQKLHCQVETVENGCEVLKALARFSYDVVLMDVEMPELDGFETTRRIRQAEQEGRYGAKPPMYIVAMTARATPRDRAECVAAGMNEHVTKPVRSDDLREVLAPLFLAKDSGFRKALAIQLGQEPIGTEPATEANDRNETHFPVDLERLMEICRDDPAELRDLTTFYFEESEALLAELDGAIQAREIGAIQTLAHKLAGSSAACGMVAVIAPLRALEEQTRAGEAKNNRSALAEILQRFEEMRSCVANYLRPFELARHQE